MALDAADEAGHQAREREHWASHVWPPKPPKPPRPTLTDRRLGADPGGVFAERAA